VVPKRKKTFHYDVFEDNSITGERLFGVKLSINAKVVAKSRAASKKRPMASKRAYFAFQEKINAK
jgi:ribonuclease-3